MIAYEQNKLLFYKFLKAQRITYSRAKTIRFSKYSLTIILAIFAPFIFIFCPNQISAIGIIGAIWMLISFLIGYIESWLVKRAATIQETYDTELYNICWNDISFGQKMVPLEYVNGVTDKYTEQELENEFKDWYEGIENIQKPLSILLCQRQNIVWDFKLRDLYSYIIIALLIINFILGLLIFSFSGETLFNYILGLVFPSLSANILGIEEAIGHLKISKRKKELENKIITLIEDIKTNNKTLKNQDLREIQNVIFNERLKAPLIPDFIYNILKKKYSNNSIASIKDLLELNK